MCSPGCSSHTITRQIQIAGKPSWELLQSSFFSIVSKQDLGPQWNHFILADAPTHNTVKDFWCMIWSQNSSCVVCLNTIDEGQILLFPKQLNIDQTFGDYTITILSEKQRLHMIERSVRVTSSEVNSTRTITILQAKQWQNKK